MLPLTLLAWNLLEAAIWCWFGQRVFGLDLTAAAIVAGGAMLGMRAGLNAVTWIFGLALASPAPRLGTWRTARMMFGEYLAYIFTFLVVIPLERLWMPADRLHGDGRVVLLVHGYGCSRGVWWRLRRRLEAAGCTVATVSLFPPFRPMGVLEQQLRERVDAVLAATGARKLSLVGHSMGGLICRSYLARHGNDKVAALITLATPHAGSALARLGAGRNAREMEPGSLWLRDLAGDAPGVPAIAFRNLYDNYVMPQDNQRLPGAHDIALPPVGHLAMLYDRRVADLLVDACQPSGK